MREHLRDLLQTTILTAAEIAERTGLSEEAVQQRAYRGTVPFVRKGKGARGNVLLFDVDDFADEIRRYEQTQQPHPSPTVDKC